MQKTSPIKLDIPSLDSLVEQMHEFAKGNDKQMVGVTALIIRHRLKLYRKNNFELDYQKYINEIKEYIRV